jgi:hemolysin activation/secretion protein
MGDHLIGRLRYADAAWLTGRQLVTFEGWLDGYYDLDDHRGENLALEALVSYRYQHARAWSLLVRGSAGAARHATLDQQLLLGGEFGLRGYPNRYQIGDRRFLVTVEERYYSNLYPLRMFRLGAAAFLDVGRAWYQDEAPAWLPQERHGDHFGVLANAGLGLRMESTRTRGDVILHLDVAFPLRDGPGVRSVEVTFTAKQTL